MRRQENQVDRVLDRMVSAALGENAHFKSHADALGIPAETIKSWRRRGEVPPGRLAAFAQDWKVSVDWLLHGDRAPDPAVQRAEQKAPRYAGLADDERKLLENYRASPSEVREALQLVASIASRRYVAAPPAARRVPAPPRVQVMSGDLPARGFAPPAERVGRKKGGKP